MWYRYKRPWGGRSFLWLMFIPMFFFFGHWWFGMIAWFFLIMAIMVIVRAASRVWSNPPSTYQQPYQPYQPYQQRDYYHTTNEYQYPLYQQGYEPQSYQEKGQEVHDAQPQRTVQQEESYEQYEQPQAQYPQELPPMQ